MRQRRQIAIGRSCATLAPIVTRLGKNFRARCTDCACSDVGQCKVANLPTPPMKLTELISRATRFARQNFLDVAVDRRSQCGGPRRRALEVPAFLDRDLSLLRPLLRVSLTSEALGYGARALQADFRADRWCHPAWCGFQRLPSCSHSDMEYTASQPMPTGRASVPRCGRWARCYLCDCVL